MMFLRIYCNTVYFPLFHANTRGGNRLTHDTICATYTVAAVSAFFDRRWQRRDAVASPAHYPRLCCLRCLHCVLLLVGPSHNLSGYIFATESWSVTARQSSSERASAKLCGIEQSQNVKRLPWRLSNGAILNDLE